MYVEGFFESLGQAFGAFIRFIVEALSGFFGILGNAIGGFIDGMSGALGVTPSLLTIAVVVIGLMLLYTALRSFLRGSIISGIIWLLLGLWLLSALIR
jgi:ABC-type proline/glycine betaine transport system permease subunit